MQILFLNVLNHMNLEQHYFEQDSSSYPLLRKIAHSLINEIITIASKKLKKRTSELIVLDVGCGYGFYSEELSKKVKKVIAVEPYIKAFNVARKRTKANLIFYNCKIEDFKTNTKFDLILSLTTLEHMPDAYASFKRIFSLLENHGIIYLTAPNKFWPLEPHYKLPFLSYLPLPLANLYLRGTGKGNSYEDSSYSKSYFGILNLLRKFPCSYTFQLPNPSSPYIGMGTKNPVYHIIKNIGIFLIWHFPLLWIFSKGFIIVIQKNEIENKNNNKLFATK